VWKTPAMIAQASREVPLQRLARPEEIAWAVIFVASDAANFMTGETLYVSGGPRVANREDQMAPAPVEAARKRAPPIRAPADQTDRQRELPKALFEAIADAGLFHLAVPRAIGGGEIDLPTYVQVIEELGKADASTGWVVNQGAIYATYAARM